MSTCYEKNNDHDSDLGFEFIAHKIKLNSQFIQNEWKTKNFAISTNSNNEQETRLTTGKV